MDRQEIIEQLKKIIEEYLKSKTIDLVDITYRYEARELFLRILIDKPEGGISLDECALLNSDISTMLDEKDIIQERYILEISSPGLDRPLKLKNDFLRSVGKEVKFFLNENIKGKIELDGVIEKVMGDSVYVNTIEGAVLIPISKINKAKQIINEV
jgi:ribosome maturation factor RimP